MEGYSVTEAASILGVPTERVWELLARGVLSGAAEGETGMRVYLQPRPAPAPPVAESARPNGDAGQREPERELSPFRELLTEFRNLTERYGQALLALGEARGEVAALRSRVDLLEARMDLRLPMGGGMPAPTPWPAPTPEPMARPPADDRTPDRHEEGEAEAQPESVDSTADEDRPSRRRRSARHATESFAEALARAEDPTRPELPGAADAAAALAALRAESSVEQPAADAALPRELPAAEPMPTLDEPHQAAAAEPVEAPEAKAEPEPEPEPVTTAEQPEAAPVAEEPVAVTEPELEPEPEPEAQPAPAAEVAAPSEPLPDAAPLSFDPDRYTVAIEEPDWWVEEATSETPPGEQETQPPSEDARSTDEPAEDATVEAGEAAVADAGDGPADEAAPSDRQEETMLWLGDVPDATRTDGGVGADEMEVVGGSPRRKPLADLPGSSELDEAMAALDAIAGRRPALAAEPEPPSAADSEPERPPPSPAWPMADRSAASPSSAKVVDARLTSTPASRAYRRLRRIFPG